jgi:hypothetical protein
VYATLEGVSSASIRAGLYHAYLVVGVLYSWVCVYVHTIYNTSVSRALFFTGWRALLRVFRYNKVI